MFPAIAEVISVEKLRAEFEPKGADPNGGGLAIGLFTWGLKASIAD